MRPNTSPIIFGLSPHCPKMADALQALNLCSRPEKEEGEH